MKISRMPLLAAIVLATLTISCAPHARVGVYADVPGPPSLSFEADPYFVPLPGTYAYAVPDYDVELYYSDGYYWRPWQGRWYRSTYYDRGWVAFSGVPRFYTHIPHNWRDDYRSRRWRGRSWDYARVPRYEVERNWSTWKRERRWDEDQRRYTGDRRWHDDGHRRDADRRDWDDRRGWDGNRQDWDGRRDNDRRESRPEYDRREPDRRDTDRRVYEQRENERRVYDSPQPTQRRVYERQPDVQRQPVERREIERRGVDVERRDIERRDVDVERRDVERRNIESGTREMQPRPAVQEQRRTIERGPAERSRGRGPEAAPQGRGQGGRDDNRDGIDDDQQRPR